MKTIKKLSEQADPLLRRFDRRAFIAGSAARALNTFRFYGKFEELELPNDIDFWLVDPDDLFDIRNELELDGYRLTYESPRAFTYRKFDPTTLSFLPQDEWWDVQIIQPTINGDEVHTGAPLRVIDSFCLNIEQAACWYEDGELQQFGYCRPEDDIVYVARLNPDPAAAMARILKAARKGFVIDNRSVYQLFESFANNPTEADTFTREIRGHWAS